MTLMKTTMALLALTTLSACDRIGEPNAERNRADATYRAAMSDYQAGRLSQAVEGFKKVCSANPANASARFQLACLLQDSLKDYSGAFCAYREYLLQCPDSDKAKLAADRLAVCEREMAKALAEKYAPRVAQEALRSAQEAKAARGKFESELAKTRAFLETANRQLEALRQENDRLKGLMRDESETDTKKSLSADEIAAARALGGEGTLGTPSVADELAEAKRQVGEDVGARPPLPVMTKDEKAARAAASRNEGQKKPVATDPYPHEPRPETYVVQEGDTLYKIAVRFYGRASAWNRIRAANRATISTDGRLRVGQKIVLPNF